MNSLTIARTSLAALGVLLLSACASDLPKMPDATDAPTLQPLRLSPGAEIEIKFYYTPELNESQVIRPDGRISLSLLEDVTAAGMTVDELHDKLVTDYSSQLLKPQLSVLVRSLPSNRVYVGGEVAKPGAIPLVGPVTVSRAIFLAEGFKTSANEEQVLLIRPGADGRPMVQEVNMDRLLSGEEGTKDVLLGPQDIVFVPRSPIANANLWVQQYIKDLVPFGLNAGVSYSINDNRDPRND